MYNVHCTGGSAHLSDPQNGYPENGIEREELPAEGLTCIAPLPPCNISPPHLPGLPDAELLEGAHAKQLREGMQAVSLCLQAHVQAIGHVQTCAEYVAVGWLSKVCCPTTNLTATFWDDFVDVEQSK